MRSKPYSRNSARNALLLLNLIILPLAGFGCSSSTTPTFNAENTEDAIRQMVRNEYGVDVIVTLLEQTLWIYLPLEDIFTKSDEPTTYTENFAIKHNDAWFQNGALSVTYDIHSIPEEEKTQEMQYNQAASENINAVWKILRRVFFSLEKHKRDELKFLSIVLADIKNGYLIHQIIYQDDFIKVSYNYISWTEFQHRMIQDSIPAPAVIDNKDAQYLAYREITMEEFLSRQIKQRVQSKFSKPEVPVDADIDAEIRKVTRHTLKIYRYEGFDTVGFYNLGTDHKVTINKSALFTGESS